MICPSNPLAHVHLTVFRLYHPLSLRPPQCPLHLPIRCPVPGNNPPGYEGLIIFRVAPEKKDSGAARADRLPPPPSTDMDDADGRQGDFGGA